MISGSKFRNFLKFGLSKGDLVGTSRFKNFLKLGLATRGLEISKFSQSSSELTRSSSSSSSFFGVVIQNFVAEFFFGVFLGSADIFPEFWDFKEKTEEEVRGVGSDSCLRRGGGEEGGPMRDEEGGEAREVGSDCCLKKGGREKGLEGPWEARGLPPAPREGPGLPPEDLGGSAREFRPARGGRARTPELLFRQKVGGEGWVDAEPELRNIGEEKNSEVPSKHGWLSANSFFGKLVPPSPSSSTRSLSVSFFGSFPKREVTVTCCLL
jgi:hypothetical protein